MNDKTFTLKNQTLAEIKNHLVNKDFSCQELTRWTLSAIDSKQSQLNAFISVQAEPALAQAKAIDQKIASRDKLGSLAGIPIAVKDNILVENTITTAGSQLLNNFTATYDSTVARRLKAEDAVLIGKTNCDEFAMGSSTEHSAFGPTRNPWDLNRVPGGSSGGSAAAVASHTVQAALGTDTGGSIRQPASYCGVVGLKPTYGRVSRYGVIAFASSLDQVGPLTCRVEDAALMLDALSGHDPRDSTSLPLPPTQTACELNAKILGGRKIRIGFAPDFLPDQLDAEVKANFESTLQTLTSLGANIQSIALPHLPYGLACYYVLAPAEASSNLARYDGVHYTSRCEHASSIKELISASRSQGFGGEVRRRILIGTFVLSSGYYDAFYLKAQAVRQCLAEDFRKAFEQVDFIVTPTAPTAAFALGDRISSPLAMYLADIFTVPVSIVGLPGISVPSGFTSNGLPLGLQIIANHRQEMPLLQIAHQFEQATRYFERDCS